MLPRPESEPAPLAKAIAGDRAAREVLLRKHGPSVWALCRRLAAEPEDAFQDVWERVFAALPRFDPEGTASLKTWIHTIAHRHLIDRHRRRTRRGQVLTLPDLAEPGPGPDQRVSDSERREHLERAMARLPAPARRVVLMHHIAEHPIADIAAAEGVAPGTIKSRLHRARAQLAKLLGSLG